MSQVQPQGYLAEPTTGSGKAVLVLHAWWGLNNDVMAFCSRLAQAGHLAFAPDLYGGKLADDIPGATALRNELVKSADRAMTDIANSVRFLHERAGKPTGGLAVIGFSLGANFALDLAAADPAHISAVVLYYGTGGGDWSTSRAAYLGHFAENDDFEPRPDVDELERSLKDAGRPVTFHHYAGAGHWFAESGRPDAYDQKAASLAWDRTLQFLGTTADA